MKRRRAYLLIVFLLSSWFGVILVTSCERRVSVSASAEQCRRMGRPARIYPEYSGVTIPPNIAPLNFSVQETGSCYFVKIHSKHGRAIEVAGRSPKIVIPPKRWRQILQANAGQELHFDIFVRTAENQWQQYDSITDRIAAEPIDRFLAYRKIRPLHNFWTAMGLYQRDLESYKEELILHTKSFHYGCVHCHSFFHHDTDKMFMHIRAANGPSMLLIEDGRATNFNSRTQFGSAPMGHPAWHPSGKVIAFTVYKVRQFLHTAKSEMREGLDTESAMGYYLFDSRTMKTAPAISRKDRLETFPTWSPDGRYLYFCSAPIWWSDHGSIPDRYDEIKYDLVRVSYDLESDTWGEQEMVLSAEETGRSVVQPRISPDGKFLLFCMCPYGCFPTFQPKSDLYLMDLNTGQYERLRCNSDQAESWHSWSSNSRWIVFSSKRRDILFNRVYISYVDEEGNVDKAFLLPQKDPTFYDSCMRLYQLPELAKSAIPVKGEALARLIRRAGEPLTDIPITSATPKAPAGSRGGDAWRSGLE